MKQVIVTTSWDDGHKLDLRLAKLLKKYGIAGTFYIAPECREIPWALRLSGQEIKALYEDFEIGSHTMTHPVLTNVGRRECAAELAESKQFLEDLLGKQITSFCYPRGAYTKEIAAQVKQAGYHYARTVLDYDFDVPANEFEAGTSIETHRFPIPRLFRFLQDLGRFCQWRPLMMLKNFGWEKRAKTMFDKVKDNGGVFHLWGHSWVIENERGWDKLELVLKYIHGHKDVMYLTNAELSKIKGQARKGQAR